MPGNVARKRHSAHRAPPVAIGYAMSFYGPVPRAKSPRAGSLTMSPSCPASAVARTPRFQTRGDCRPEPAPGTRRSLTECRWPPACAIQSAVSAFSASGIEIRTASVAIDFRPPSPALRLTNAPCRLFTLSERGPVIGKKPFQFGTIANVAEADTVPYLDNPWQRPLRLRLDHCICNHFWNPKDRRSPSPKP